MRRSLRMGLRERTTLLSAAAAAVALTAAAVALLLTLDAQLTGSREDLARTRARDLLELAESGRLGPSVRNVGEDDMAQVVDARGRVLAASPNIDGAPAVVAVGPGLRLGPRTLEAPDDGETERYRVWVDRGPSPYGQVVVVTGTSLESVAEATGAVRQALLLGVPVVVLLLAAATWVLVGAALRRVERIRAQVDAISDAEQDVRVPVSGVDDEVGRLAVTMNRMLDRLEEASRRQRGFVADASHDLQSPLAAQRSTLEVALRYPDRHDPSALATELLGSVAEMEQLVGDLLYLATPDDPSRAGRREWLDLEDVVLEEAARVAAGAGAVVDTGEVSAGPVVGDPAALRRLVRNLLDNAVRHARDRVAVRLRVEDGRRLVLDVVDDGPGIDPAERERVFDRFYRGDPARARGVGHGLGLAIARSVAEAHGGDLRVVDSAEGAHLRLRMPCAWEPPPPGPEAGATLAAGVQPQPGERGRSSWVSSFVSRWRRASAPSASTDRR